MSLIDRWDGYYDKKGKWQRTKKCFVQCPPERCTCGPPGGVWQRRPVIKDSIRPQLAQDIDASKEQDDE